MMLDLPGLLAPRMRRLVPGISPQLTVWEVSLQEPAAPSPYEAVLSAGELSRADTFLRLHLRRRHVWSRLALRHLLGVRLDCMAGDLALQYSSTGRPFVSGAALDFNISHSADVALIAALDGGARTGVDVEAMVPRGNMDQVGRRVFTKREMAEDAQDCVSPTEAFYRRWTCKEAYLKAVGSGLRFDPRRVVLGFSPDCVATVRDGPLTEGCKLVSFMPQPGFMAAVAILPDGPT